MLEEALNYLISAAGLGAVAYMVLHWLDLHWLWFSELRSDLKRGFSLVSSFLLGAAVGVPAFLFLVALGATGPPGTWQDWSRLIFTWGMGAVAGAQGYHARELVPPVANGE